MSPITDLLIKYNKYFITSNKALLWNSLHLSLPNEKKDLIKNVEGYSQLFNLITVVEFLTYV